jgi:SNF2 family DNA or RNA helicase
MKLKLEYLEDPIRAVLAADEEIPASTWYRVSDLVLSIEPDARIAGRVIEIEWSSLLSIAAKLADIRRDYSFGIEYNDAARAQLKRYRDEYRAIRNVDVRRLDITEENIQERLRELGWKRELKDAQKRDAVRMLALPNSANFSVPGAGKTTVAFAVHLLSKAPETLLLVVGPKNAFSAWDEVISDNLNTSPESIADLSKFVRLEGGVDAIEEALSTAKHNRLLISYDQLIRVTELVGDMLRRNSVHVILDESHRMKAGDRSQRGVALLSLSHLPIRRDILSGTPIPRAIDDIAPQVDFLWPGQGLGRRIVSAASPKDHLRGLYVRTTKHELKLPPRFTHFDPVPMSSQQLAFYSLMRDEALKRLRGIRSTSNIDLTNARRSVMRLLQAASNPILAVKRMTNEEPNAFPYDDPTIEAIFTAIVADSDSPKLLRACDLARQLLNKPGDARVVIWSSFTENVERIAQLLADYGATFIHGGVPVGNDDDPNTREGRIKAFHSTDLNCRVLVANPAACSEGISLHHVCHNAIYVDRTYNAGHYLQSVDRIHRLGLADNIETHIYILESIAPSLIGSIDYSVRRRLILKLRTMADALEDEDLRKLALDEEEGEQPIDYDMDMEDLSDVIDELTGKAAAPGDGDE